MKRSEFGRKLAKEFLRFTATALVKGESVWLDYEDQDKFFSRITVEERGITLHSKGEVTDMKKDIFSQIEIVVNYKNHIQGWAKEGYKEEVKKILNLLEENKVKALKKLKDYNRPSKVADKL